MIFSLDFSPMTYAFIIILFQLPCYYTMLFAITPWLLLMILLPFYYAYAKITYFHAAYFACHYAASFIDAFPFFAAIELPLLIIYIRCYFHFLIVFLLILHYFSLRVQVDYFDDAFAITLRC